MMNMSKLAHDYELEEGEINDDVQAKGVHMKPSKKHSRCRKLPKRYMLNSSTKEGSAKKKCRHNTRAHFTHRDSVKKSTTTHKSHASSRHTSVKCPVDGRKKGQKKFTTPIRGTFFKERRVDGSFLHKRCQNARDTDKRHFPARVSHRASKSLNECDSKLTPKRRIGIIGSGSEVFKSKSPAAVNSNSSFEDLLSQYKFIQKELDRMKSPEKISLENVKYLKLPEKKRHSITASISLTKKGSNDCVSEHVCPKKFRRCSVIKNCKTSLVQIDKTAGVSVKENCGSAAADDDDLQALRQKALASCADNIARKAKHKSDLEKIAVIAEQDISNEQSAELDDNRTADFVHKDADNYDLLDMELDSEDELSDAVEIQMCSDESDTILNVISDAAVNATGGTGFEEELDEEILRAELILSLGCRKKVQMDEKLGNSSPAHSEDSAALFSTEQPPVNDGEKCSMSQVDDLPRLVDFQHNYFENSAAAYGVPEGKKIIFPDLNPVLQLSDEGHKPKESQVREKVVHYFNPQKPIVISLRDDSSSDGSDTEDMQGNCANAIASLELLVKDARNESDSVSSRSVIAPDAVACLSKAQQQEYNKLREIIAKKECSKYEPPKVVHSTLLQQDLQVLEDKLNVARAILDKRNQVLNALRVQAAKEKIYNEKTLLAIAKLKQQLRASEAKKKQAESSIKVLHGRIRGIKNDNEKHQSLISDLEINCKKLGLRIKGPGYCLPVPSPITSMLVKKGS